MNSPKSITELLGLCNFIMKSVMRIIVVICAVIVVIATRCPFSHCRATSDHSKVFTTGQTRINPEHYAIKFVGGR